MSLPVELLVWTRAWLAFLMLFGAALLDVQYRWVPNRYWWPFLILGVVIGALEVIVYGASMAIVLGASLALLPVFYGFWRLGWFGGADAKALMALALLLPLFPGGLMVPAVLPVLGGGVVLAGVVAGIDNKRSEELTFLLFLFLGFLLAWAAAVL